MALFRGPVIITGGAGFLGANLAAHLLASDTGADVLIVDDCRRGSWANLLEACRRAHVPAYPGDFLADACADIEWRDFLEDIQPAAVFHLAGGARGKNQSEKQYLFDEIEGFRGLLYAAIDQGIPLVYASDASVYGRQDAERVAESAAGMPSSIEGFAKWTIENIHRQAMELRDPSDPPVQVVGVRIFEAFGPGESLDHEAGSLPSRIAAHWRRGEPAPIGAPDAMIDCIAARDVVTCLVAATARGVRSGVYNCGSGERRSMRDVATALRDGMGRTEADAPLAVDGSGACETSFPNADLRAVTTALDWRPAQAALDAVHEYGAWLAANGDVAAE